MSEDWGEGRERLGLDGMSYWHEDKSRYRKSSIKPPPPPPPPLSQIRPLPLIYPPFQWKKIIRPPLPTPNYSSLIRDTVLINHDCKTACGLIRDGLFTNWKFGLDSNPRLHDLQPSCVWAFPLCVLVLMEKSYPPPFQKKKTPPQKTPPPFFPPPPPPPPQMGLK